MLDSLRHRALVGAAIPRQEVGDAGHQDHVGIGTDLADGLSQHIKTIAGDALGILHQRTIAAIEGCHVPDHVVITKHRKNPGLRHREALNQNRKHVALGSTRQNDLKKETRKRGRGRVDERTRRRHGQALHGRSEHTTDEAQKGTTTFELRIL